MRVLLEEQHGVRLPRPGHREPPDELLGVPVVEPDEAEGGAVAVLERRGQEAKANNVSLRM